MTSIVPKYLLLAAGSLIIVGFVPTIVFQHPDRILRASFLSPLPEIQVWLILLCVQSIMWVFGLAAVVSSVRQIIRTGIPLREVLVILVLEVAVACFVGALFVFLPRDYQPLTGIGPQYTFAPGYGVFVLAGFYIGFAILPVMLLISLGARHPIGLSISAAFNRLIELHSALDRLVVIAAIMIGLSTLSTGALRFALACGEPRRDWSAATVVLWGLGGSVALALFYVPVRAILAAAGQTMKRALNPFPAAASGDSLIQWYETEEKLDRLLRLRVTDWNSISGGLGTLAPLLLGWIVTALK